MGLCGNFTQFNQLIDTDLFNLISNPDKSDETDPDLMATIPMSNYYSISQIDNVIAKAVSTVVQKEMTTIYVQLESRPFHLNKTQTWVMLIHHCIHAI